MQEPERLTAFIALDLSMIRPADLSDEHFIQWVQFCLRSSIVNRHGIIDAQRIEVQLGERGTAGERVVIEEFAHMESAAMEHSSIGLILAARNVVSGLNDAGITLARRVAARLLGPPEDTRRQQ